MLMQCIASFFNNNNSCCNHNSNNIGISPSIIIARCETVQKLATIADWYLKYPVTAVTNFFRCNNNWGGERGEGPLCHSGTVP